MASASDISDRILEAVLARKLAPGSRLGEQPLASLFGCSRTIVREALTRLAVRGIVIASARRGWYLVEPSEDEARETFDARRVIETGLIRDTSAIGKPGVKRLRLHLARQKAALKGQDVGLRSFLLGDFHVCLAECLGNHQLAEILRDLTARTTLTAMKHQSTHDASKSCSEHERIVDALSAGDMAAAERLMAMHLTTWRAKLPIPVEADPLRQLRQALQPVDSSPQAPGDAPSSSKRPSPRSKPFAQLGESS